MSDFADLKKATDINPNVWYHLTEENVDDYDGDFKSMLQTHKEDSGDDGFRVFGVGNRKTYWQFVRLIDRGVTQYPKFLTKLPATHRKQARAIFPSLLRNNDTKTVRRMLSRFRIGRESTHTRLSVRQ